MSTIPRYSLLPFKAPQNENKDYNKYFMVQPRNVVRNVVRNVFQYIWKGNVIEKNDPAVFYDIKAEYFDPRQLIRECCRKSCFKRCLDCTFDKIFVKQQKLIIDSHQKGEKNRLIFDGKDISLQKHIQGHIDALLCYRNTRLVAKALMYSSCRDLHVVIDCPDSDWTNNAGWVKEDNCVYVGRTDPDEYREPFCANRDIIAHEFGHAFVDETAKFEYKFQSGALHESCADLCAIWIKQGEKDLPANHPDNDWLIAPRILRNDQGFGAIRSVSNPGSAHDQDQQPKLMQDFVELSESEEGDYGGIHINSGIPSYAFYLAATDINYSTWWMATVWKSALNESSPTDDFATFARRTIEATEGYSQAQNSVAKAWCDVGVLN